jgi:DNA-binding transcriptional MerR regulator
MSEQVMAGEAARMLGINPSWIRRLELAGEIPPARRLARFRIYTPAEVEYLRLLLEQRKANRKAARVAKSATD